MCYGDQNYHQQAIYLNFPNFLIIQQSKNNNQNLFFSAWYLAPILPGLRYHYPELDCHSKASYYLEPDYGSKNKIIKVEIDLSNYAKKVRK